MNGTQDGHAKIYTDWQQLEGASWMASFHAEFFFHLFIFLTRFILLLVYVSGFQGDRKKKKAKKREYSMSGVFLD